jgi:Mg-chelatase subunit ChlD
MSPTDPGLERWRLILGSAVENSITVGDGVRARQDAALDWLYGRDEELRERGVRRGGARPSGRERAGEDRDGEPARQRSAGSEPSVLATVDWLDEIHQLFPRRTVERLERDAVDVYQINEIVTDPEVLERVEPSASLLRAVLRTKHLMNPRVLALARRIVDAVVRDLLQRLRPEVQAAFHGTRSQQPSRFRQARDFDFRGTVKANLRHYQPEERRILIEHPHFHSRTRKNLQKWQLILVVDQSGSMVGSVIHSAVTAACLWNLPGLKTHLVAFDTNVVDLTEDVTDPVELLMKVQLGGGTDIAKAVRYAEGLVDNPRRTIVAVISDFYEGGDSHGLVRSVRSLTDQGTVVLGLAALDEDAFPAYNKELAQLLANAGAQVGAMTPGELAAFVAEKLGR